MVAFCHQQSRHSTRSCHCPVAWLVTALLLTAGGGVIHPVYVAIEGNVGLLATLALAAAWPGR